MSKSSNDALVLPVSDIMCFGELIPCKKAGTSLHVLGPRVLLTVAGENIPTITLHLECDVLKCEVSDPKDEPDDKFETEHVVMILDVMLTRQMTETLEQFWKVKKDLVCTTRLGVKFEAKSKGWVQEQYEMFVNSLRPNFFRGQWVTHNGADASLIAWLSLILDQPAEESNEVVVGSDDMEVSPIVEGAVGSERDEEAVIPGNQVALDLDSDMQVFLPALRLEDIIDLDNCSDEPQEGGPELVLNKNFLSTDRLRKDDFGRLEPGEWLSDGLIDLFMSYFLRTVDPSLTNKVSSPMTYFITKLRSTDLTLAERWDVSKRLFELDYVFLPVNSSGNHWYLIIIDHPERSKHVEADPGYPNTMVFILDSRGPSEHRKDSQFVKNWIQRMAKIQGLNRTREIQVVHPRVPLQPNLDDCGLYVLHFTRVFLQDPTRILQEMLDSEGTIGPYDHIDQVWEHEKVPKMREELKNIILEK